jgi:hypothetical protein
MATMYVSVKSEEKRELRPEPPVDAVGAVARGGLTSARRQSNRVASARRRSCRVAIRGAVSTSYGVLDRDRIAAEP